MPKYNNYHDAVVDLKLFDHKTSGDILKLSDHNGWTIAHELASQGILFTKRKDILSLENTAGLSVNDVSEFDEK